MKRILIIFLTICVASACSDDFTDLAPISNRNEADFFNNEGDFIVSLNASYAGLQDNGVYGRAYWTMFEMRGDNTDQGPDATGLARVFTEINAFTEDPLNEQIDAAWSGSYRVIANCNVILDRIGSADFDEGLRNRIIGEALFLRSLMYYHLAIAFGNIPLQLTPFVPGDELTQVDASTIYAQLVSDLETAETNLPISYPDSDLGRATRGAAATLLAKVLLTTGQDSEAEIVLRRIVDQYGYQLLPNYADLWGASNENNAESIFEVQFISGGIGQGSAYSNDFSPSSFLQTGQGFGRNRPTATMQNAYVAGDLRFEASMDTTWINAESEVVVQNFVTKYESDPPIENDSDINFVVFRYADVLLMLAEAIGESQESYDLINQVRIRAGLTGIDASTPGTFEEKLLDERQVELAFENHRWPDLLRFGVATEKLIEAESDVIEPASIRNLFFIPQRELDINPSFIQND
ncbi:RagB/SusD family nutrient uptake outer membrane protein [Flagellimonas meridianipacifica]|uniref:Putative outer membrane starch-binding protein n=1 Tax=Flagellimonas meridianipacifica TaxID=1080225 RepID=A0A2T0MBX2_9FLAO|nr:RagB/SusD family nutrient uptake outer membrane protein [Allomuricauda pacifica]PRX54932.1 putative outer membrane starch-binding protein [Allomuricauda pacifica]